MEENVTIGKQLKFSREQKKLSLEQVSSKTKININILKDLESDNFADLPNITYVRGFVKSFAKTVGLDPTEAKVLFEKTYSPKFKVETHVNEAKASPTENKTKPLKKVEIKEPVISTEQAEEYKQNVISFVQGLFKKKVIVPLTALLILIFIFKSIFSWISTLINEPGKQIPVNSELLSQEVAPQNIQTIPTASEIPREEISEVEELIEVTVDSQAPVPTKEVEPEIDKTPKLQAGELPYKDFYPAPLKTFTTITDAPEAADRRLLPPNILASAEQDKQNVYIVADSDDTWLSFKIDDEPIKRFVLQKDRRLFLKGDRVLLFIGNYNATKVFYNNKFVDTDTKSGVKSLIFPPEIAKDLVLPLFPSYKGIPYEANEYLKKMAPKEN